MEPSIEIPDNFKCMHSDGMLGKCVSDEGSQFFNVTNVGKEEWSCNQTEKLVNIFMSMSLNEAVKF